MEEPLQRFGYQILEQVKDEDGYFSRLSAKKSKEDLYFQIERIDEKYLDTFSCYVKMVGESDIEIQFTLKPKSTTYFTAIKEKGISDDYFIDSEYEESQIFQFLSNERIFPIVQDILKNSLDRQLNIASKGGKFLIRAKTNCDYTTSLASIPAFETLIWIFQIEKTFDKLVTEIGSYACHNCKRILVTSQKICPNCNAVTPKCIICLRTPDMIKGVVQITCCQSYAHKNELVAWFDLKKTCPYCLAEQYEIRKIQNS